MSYHIGSKLPFSVHFEDAAGADADPTTVRFFLREEVDGTEREWTFNASAVEGTHYPTGTNPIVKDSTGDYSLSYIARKTERHSGVWIGNGSVFHVKKETFLVRHTDVAAIDNP